LLLRWATDLSSPLSDSSSRSLISNFHLQNWNWVISVQPASSWHTEAHSKH
jgi:hypothetical protein